MIEFALSERRDEKGGLSSVESCWLKVKHILFHRCGSSDVFTSEHLASRSVIELTLYYSNMKASN